MHLFLLWYLKRGWASCFYAVSNRTAGAFGVVIGYSCGAVSSCQMCIHRVLPDPFWSGGTPWFSGKVIVSRDTCSLEHLSIVGWEKCDKVHFKVLERACVGQTALWRGASPNSGTARASRSPAENQLLFWFFLADILCCFTSSPAGSFPSSVKIMQGCLRAHKHSQSPWCYLEPFHDCGEEKTYRGNFPSPPPQPSISDSRYFEDGHETRRGWQSWRKVG